MISRSEVLLRLNYMASITWSSFGLVFLLAYPIYGRLLSPLVVLAALPYFLAMASDLKYSGYKRTDIFRIYGFNLILLPVNLAGVLKSMQQALSGKKIPFARTPKVKERTVSPMFYVIAPLFIVGFSVFTLWRDARLQNWGNVAFAAFNALTATWAIVGFIGIKNTLVDVWLAIINWLYVPVNKRLANRKPERSNNLDWQAVLYHGDPEIQLSDGAINHLIFTSTMQSHEESQVVSS